MADCLPHHQEDAYAAFHDMFTIFLNDNFGNESVRDQLQAYAEYTDLQLNKPLSEFGSHDLIVPQNMELVLEHIESSGLRQEIWLTRNEEELAIARANEAADSDPEFVDAIPIEPPPVVEAPPMSTHDKYKDFPRLAFLGAVLECLDRQYSDQDSLLCGYFESLPELAKNGDYPRRWHTDAFCRILHEAPENLIEAIEHIMLFDLFPITVYQMSLEPEGVSR